eukprot:scaffold83212_cov59-Attheya_sp.AAC.5
MPMQRWQLFGSGSLLLRQRAWLSLPRQVDHQLLICPPFSKLPSRVHQAQAQPQLEQTSRCYNLKRRWRTWSALSDQKECNLEVWDGGARARQEHGLTSS